MNRLSSVSLFAAALFLSNAAGAQANGPAQKEPRANIVSTNPFGMLFEWYNGEIEHALSPTSSIAVAASHAGFIEDGYTAVDAIIRYYPSAQAIRGFAFGGSVGFARTTDQSGCFDCNGREVTTHDTALAVGVRGDYIWILGRDQRFSAATGIGARRLFYSGNDHSGPEGLPIFRLSVGYAW